MRRLFLSLAVPVLAIALAVTAFAVVPGLWSTLDPRSTPSPLATSAPAWKVGDTWTYNVSLGSTGEDSLIPPEMIVQWNENATHVIGTLKETVVGNVSTHDGIAWNVTETLLLLVEHRSSVLGPEPGMASQDGPSANVSGFVWYRQADLAPLYARKSVHMVRTWNVSSPEDMSTFDHMWLNGTYTLTYDAGTEVWFHPGLTVLRFPLAENVTYNVTSNATIHTWSSFKVNGPNVTWGTDHFATFTVPIGLTLRTGQFENVTTPAGTFRALPVSAYRRPFVPPTEDRDANVVTNLTLETDCETPHAFATAWFSAQAGNVVRADLGLGGFEGPRIVLTLVAYSSG